jgi:hypothetical protein
MQSMKANVLLIGGKEGSVKLIPTRQDWELGAVLLTVIDHRPLQSSLGLKLRSELLI